MKLKRSQKTLKITESEYHQHRNDYNGFCTECGAIAFGDTEPDAEYYECEKCGEQAVMGIEQAMLHGIIDIKFGGNNEK